MKKEIFLFVFFTLNIQFTVFSQVVNQLINRKSQIDSMLIKEMKVRKIPGLTYGIYGKDSLLLVNALGYSDVQNRAPTRDSTIFELASITKQFTSAAILILQQEGKLKATDKACNYISNCPEEWKEITLLHLMSHTSGLPGLYDNDGFNNKAYSGIDTMSTERILKHIRNWDKNFTLDAIKSDKLLSTPGEKFEYSDVGYVLLGIIIDNVTGSYRNFIHNKILDPAGMYSTYILDQQAVHPYEARGYSLKNGELINITRFGDKEIPSHYGIFSSVIDMQKWDAALNSDLILSEESKKLLWTSYVLDNGRALNYGLGWEILDLGNKKIVSHSGITGTEFLKIVDDKISICVLTNLGYNGNDQVNSWGLCKEIAKILNLNILIDHNYVNSKGMNIIPFKQSTLNKIIGEYKIRNGIVPIFLREKKVFIQTPFGEYEIVQLDSGDFILLGTDKELIIRPLDNDFNRILINDAIEGRKLTKQ